MLIITTTKKGTLRLPKDVLRVLNGTTHLQVRFSAHGITLTPVQIQAAKCLKSIPDAKPAPPRA